MAARSSAIDTAKDEHITALTASHGRQPATREVIQLRQQATPATRGDKQVRPLDPVDSRGRECNRH